LRRRGSEIQRAQREDVGDAESVTRQKLTCVERSIDYFEKMHGAIALAAAMASH